MNRRKQRGTENIWIRVPTKLLKQCCSLINADLKGILLTEAQSPLRGKETISSALRPCTGVPEKCDDTKPNGFSIGTPTASKRFPSRKVTG
jgi:hypothetical protein